MAKIFKILSIIYIIVSIIILILDYQDDYIYSFFVPTYCMTNIAISFILFGIGYSIQKIEDGYDYIIKIHKKIVKKK